MSATRHHAGIAFELAGPGKYRLKIENPEGVVLSRGDLAMVASFGAARAASESGQKEARDDIFAALGIEPVR